MIIYIPLFIIIDDYFYTYESRNLQEARRTHTGEDPQPLRARTQTRVREVFDLNTQAKIWRASGKR